MADLVRKPRERFEILRLLELKRQALHLNVANPGQDELTLKLRVISADREYLIKCG